MNTDNAVPPQNSTKNLKPNSCYLNVKTIDPPTFQTTANIKPIGLNQTGETLTNQATAAGRPTRSSKSSRITEDTAPLFRRPGSPSSTVTEKVNRYTICRTSFLSDNEIQALGISLLSSNRADDGGEVKQEEVVFLLPSSDYKCLMVTNKDFGKLDEYDGGIGNTLLEVHPPLQPLKSNIITTTTQPDNISNNNIPFINILPNLTQLKGQSSSIIHKSLAFLQAELTNFKIQTPTLTVKPGKFLKAYQTTSTKNTTLKKRVCQTRGLSRLMKGTSFYWVTDIRVFRVKFFGCFRGFAELVMTTLHVVQLGFIW